MIIFRLRPVDGEFEIRLPEDAVPVAETTQAIIVPATVSTSAIIEPETNKKTMSSRSATPQTSAQRREAELSDKFQAFMAARNRTMKRFQITIEGLASPLLTDLYDPASHVLYELKGDCSRESIRMAIGQLLDYSRHIQPPHPTLAVLLPGRPHEDLCNLLATVKIALVYWDGTTFIGVPGL